MCCVEDFCSAPACCIYAYDKAGSLCTNRLVLLRCEHQVKRSAERGYLARS